MSEQAYYQDLINRGKSIANSKSYLEYLNGLQAEGTKFRTTNKTVEDYGADSTKKAKYQIPAMAAVITGTDGNKYRKLFGFENGYVRTDDITSDGYAIIGSKIFQTYKTGGLADFTGPAWLDGTKSHPEYVLSAAQTERFFALVDILEGFNKDTTQNAQTGDNYYDIEINVENIEDDYSVEQLAEKVRTMIYNDATYRNVNAVSR